MWKFSARHAKNRRHIEQLKDIHKGKRAFIICNGPSLTAADLDKIAEYGEISFGCNKIDKIFPQTVWRPKYYCVFDESLQFSILSTMNKIPADLKFFREQSYLTTRHVNSECIWLNADGNRALLENPCFAEDVTNKIYAIATATYCMLQIAVHMGIRELYILGCDNKYGLECRKDGSIINNNTNSYFQGADKSQNKIIASTWEMNAAYEFAAKYASGHNINIYNATRGGFLEAFPRVDFDSLF